MLLGIASPAQAHNQLIDSDPANQDTVETGPAQVRLEFLATLDPDDAVLDVTGPDGSSVVDGEPEFDGAVVSIPIHAELAGDYEVTFDVLSADGHWVDGEVTFTVTTGTEPTTSPTPTPPPPPPPAPSPTPAPAGASEAEDDGGGLAWWVWLLVAGVLAAAAYGTYRLRRAAGR